MTGHIIQLSADPHQEALSLLPWYVTGRLDADDQAVVEAHLSGCAECRAELALERRLHAAVAELPAPVDNGWAQLRDRVAREARAAEVKPNPKPVGAGGEIARQWSGGGSWLRWAAAAQFGLLVALGSLLLQQQDAHRARYHALGAAPVTAAANVVVIFRPETSERELRQVLNAAHARLVDGPTTADAYLLHVPALERATALTSLRGSPRIELAEPVDSGDSP